MSLLEAYGGCGCSGGAETASTQALANTGLVKEIVGKIAHLHGKKIDMNGTSTELVARLREIIPDPRKKSNGGKGTQYGNNAEGNRKICAGMAKIINDAFQANVINVSASPSEICDQIAEEMTSLAAGVGAQFSGVRKYTERILNNLNALEKLHAVTFARMEAKIKEADAEAGDGTAYANTAVLRDFHNTIHAEMERQKHLLTNMLGVMTPGSATDAELEAALKHSQQLKGFVRSIKNSAPGQASFGEKLGFLMAGTQSTTAAMAALNKALEKLGVTRAELARVDGIAAAENLMATKIEGKLGKASNEELGKLMKAQKGILAKLYMLKDLGAKDPLTAISGGLEDYSDIEVAGGDQKLDKRIKERSLIRKGLVRQFGIRKAALWATMVRAADDFAKAVSTGRVKLSDKLDGFDTAMSLISTLSPNMYYALSGYYNDASARQSRESFIGNLEYVISTITALQTEAGYASLDSLRSMKAALQEIIKLIGEYSTRYETGFDTIAPPKGRTADSPSDLSVAANSLVKGGDELDNVEMLGGFGVSPAVADAAGVAGSALACSGLKIASAAMKCGGDEPDLENPSLNKVADDLERTREIITYAFRTRRIRDNLAVMSQELPHYSEDYTKITGDAVAEAVDRENTNLGLWQKENTRATVAPAGAVPAASVNLYDRLLEADIAAAPGTTELTLPAAKIVADAAAMRTSAAAARTSMYRTAEAVDMYMQKFAALVASAPDDLRSVIDDVSDSHVNAAWFTNTSGDAICKVFDACPSAYTNTFVPIYSDLNSVASGHYYERLGMLAAGAVPAGCKAQAIARADPPAPRPAGGLALPGNPYIGQAATEAGQTIGYQAHLKLAAEALKVTSLKNIIATFLNFADKFGGKQISTQIPMTIAEIYANLNQYIAVSAFSCVRNVPAAGAGLPAINVAAVATRAYAAGAAGTAASYANSGSTEVASAAGPVGTPLEISRHINATYAMRGVTGQGAYGDAFTETDMLFRMSIKSIVSKIFVARGMHDILNRPIAIAGLGYFNDLRLVVGGGAVKVIPDALELYIRLPLLAEFYRTIFVFPNAAAEKSITMVPEMDGTFTGLIAFIFDRAAHVTDGNYSDTEVATLISEINRIYERFSKSANPVMNSIDAFIAEINARYGVVSRKDQDAFQKARQDRWKSSHKNIEPSDSADFALPEFDEGEKYNRPMPSQMYEMGRGAGDRADPKHKYKLDLAANSSMITGLRDSIYDLFHATEDRLSTPAADEFEDAITLQRDIGKRITLKHLLRARAEEMRYAKTDDERFEVVRSAINSLGQYSLSALEKSYVAFHEYVIAPLNVLRSAYNEAEEYRDHIERMYLAFSTMKSLRMVGAAARTCAQWVALLDEVLGNADDAAAHAAIVANGATGGCPLEALPGLRALLAFVRDVEQDIPAGAAGPAYAIPAAPVEWILQGGAGPAPTWIQLDAAGLTPEQQAQVAERFLLQNNRLMRQLLETVYVHGCTLDKFVDLRIEVVTRMVEGSTCAIDINVDHSKLIEHVQSTINTVKGIYGKFRGLLPAEKIKMYEDVTCPGSIFWLEREFLDILVRGRGEGAASEKRSLDRTNGRIKEILGWLTTAWTVRAGGVTVVAADPKQSHSYLATLASMIAGGFAVEDIAGAGNGFGSYESLGSTIFASYYNRSNKKLGATDPGALWPGLAATPNRSTDVTIAGLGKPNGVVAQMNSLLAAFLRIAYDAPTQKLFAPLLSEFANGAMSAAVMGGIGTRINDSVATGPVAVMEQANVLYNSLAIALNHYLVDKAGDGKTPLYLDSDVANLQTYTKEQMRSELPLFQHMFQELIRRCDFLKSMVRAFCVINYNGIAHTAAAYTVDRDARQTAAGILLDKVISGTMALNNGAKEALKLVGDDPKYFELSQDFIANYRALNSCDPLMPLSSSAVVLRAGEQYYEQLMIPGAAYSTPVQKTHYGVRGILSGETRAAAMPGVLEIAKGHNQACDKRFNIDESEIVAVANATFELERFLVGARIFRRWISVRRLFAGAYSPTQDYIRTGTMTTAVVATDSAGVQVPVRAFSLLPTNRLEHTVRMTETNAQKDQRRAIVQIVERTDQCQLLGGRKDMIVFNLIDTGKVPIVLHALMRDMPLLMLHLYSGEFDKSVNAVFDTKAVVRAAITEAEAPNGKAMLAEMLVNPHAVISDDIYDTRFAQIVRGDLSIAGLAQPKMLGQELYSKALIGEIYPGQVYAEETDPALGDAHLRGKQEVLKDGAMRDLRAPLLVQHILTVLFGAGGVWPGTLPAGLPMAKYSQYATNGTVPFGQIINDVIATHPAAAAGSAATAADVNAYAGAVGVPPANLAAGGPASAADQAWIAQVFNSANHVRMVAIAVGVYSRQQISVLGDPARNPGAILAAGRTVAGSISAMFAALDAAFSAGAAVATPIPVGGTVIAAHPTDPAAATTGFAAAETTAWLAANRLHLEANWADVPREGRVAVQSRNPRYFPAELMFMPLNNKKGAMTPAGPTAVNVGGHKDLLQAIGKLRFDTYFARNIIWMTNIQRFVLLKLSTDYTWSNSKVVSGPAILARGNTEFYGNDMNRGKGRSYAPGNYKY